jgi:hypothetical protein
MVGSFVDGRGSNPSQVIWEAPGRIRLAIAGRPTAIYDDVSGLQNANAFSEADTDILESLFDDSPEGLFYALARGAAFRLIGNRVRTDNGRTPNYPGPWYDVYSTTGPVLAKSRAISRQKYYYFDSVTGLLRRTVYVLPSSVRVSTEYNNWSTNAGQAFPGQIQRRHGATVIFTLNATGAAVSPRANDGVFPNR